MESSCRLRSLFKTLTSQIQILRPFSSSSAAATTGDWGFYTEDNNTDDDCKESAVYKHVLKFQRPSTLETVDWREKVHLRRHLHNTAKFIGTVDLPLKRINSTYGRFVVHTLLKINSSRDSNRSVRIGLQMWDEIAEVSMRHIKPNDYIHVSGRLQSYQKADMNGYLRTKYSVIVKDINYVAQLAQHDKASTCPKAEQFGFEDSKEIALEKRREHLHLWQVFFANPFEWWDNRKCKLNPKWPDFRHKSTGEALWLSPHSDPPWIRKQLQRHDSRMAENGSAEWEEYGSDVPALVYDDL